MNGGGAPRTQEERGGEGRCMGNVRARITRTLSELDSNGYSLQLYPTRIELAPVQRNPSPLRSVPLGLEPRCWPSVDEHLFALNCQSIRAPARVALGAALNAETLRSGAERCVQHPALQFSVGSSDWGVTTKSEGNWRQVNINVRRGGPEGKQVRPRVRSDVSRGPTRGAV